VFEQLTWPVTNLILSFGYLGVFISMIVNSNFIPIHSEIILPFAGFLASQGKLSLPLILTTSVLGDLIGATIGYHVGYFLEETAVTSLIKKYGKFVFIKENDYKKVTDWINKYGAPVVFVAKLTPGLKSISSIVSGLSKIKFSRFLLCVLFASVIYNFILIYLGFYLGSNWAILGFYVKKVEIIIMLLVLGGIVFYINHKLKIIKLPKVR